MLFDIKAFLLEIFLMILGFGLRKFKIKIPGEILILIGFFGVVATISYGKFYTFNIVFNPYFPLFAFCSIILIVSILLRNHRPKTFPISYSLKSKPVTSLSEDVKIAPEDYFPQLNLQSLKIWGKKWGNQYDHLSSVFLYDNSLGHSNQYKYTLFFEFENNQGGETNKTKFDEMTWNIEAYPISECKDDIYKTNPSEIDFIYEWFITTEVPEIVDQESVFVVFSKQNHDLRQPQNSAD